MATFESTYGSSGSAAEIGWTKIVNAPGAYKHIRVTSWWAHGNEIDPYNPYVLANKNWTFYFGCDSQSDAIWSETYNNSSNAQAKKLTSFHSSAVPLALNLPQNEALWFKTSGSCKNLWYLTIVYSIINDNTAPGTPTILWPAAASKTTYNSIPYFKMKATDAQSDTMTYQYKIDSGAWMNVDTNVASGTEKSWNFSAVTAGSHTLYVRAYDGKAYSSEASRAFTYTAPASLSGNPAINASHMSTLKTYIDNLSAYYGTGSSTTITAPTKETDKIANSNWTNYVTKINATPNISGMANPGQYKKADQSYYNSFITKLKSG